MLVICSLMNKKHQFNLLIFIFSIMMFSSCVNHNNELLDERIKVALRSVGDQLLHSNKDSTSLVLPVVKFDNQKYRISFQNKLSIQPENLVDLIQDNFEKSPLPKSYIVEVIQCIDKEVAYSYESKNKTDKSIIPCKGRELTKKCYHIEVKIILDETPISYSKYLLLVLPILIIISIFLFKRKTIYNALESSENYINIGMFKFYAEQHKLLIDNEEIKLSKKECELLVIFIKTPNKVVKREELMKQVWEDNGVFVGRSLDTYISKLRKILKADNSIKLTNIHGVGYKLEVK